MSYPRFIIVHEPEARALEDVLRHARLRNSRRRLKPSGDFLALEEAWSFAKENGGLEDLKVLGLSVGSLNEIVEAISEARRLGIAEPGHFHLVTARALGLACERLAAVEDGMALDGERAAAPAAWRSTLMTKALHDVGVGANPGPYV